MIFNKSSPELYARELLHSLDIKNIPVNPFEICDILHIDICYEPLRQSEAVLLIKNGSHRVILNQNISYQPRLKLKADNFNCLFEGIDFEIKPDGTIIFK